MGYMSEINHAIPIKASVKVVYHALTTLDGLRAWFTAQTNGSGKVGTNWVLKFTDQPSFTWKISTLEDQNLILWTCLEGPGNAAGTEVEFTLASQSDHTILTILHRGWIKEDPKFDRCVEIWRILMNHFQQYCETGTANPAYH